MISSTFLRIAGLAGIIVLSVCPLAKAKPNIVLIYADDLGYGDVSCYNADSKIPTPNIDQLAEQGVRFTDAHSPDTICSPSRYGILTGRYSWRTKIKAGNPPIGSQPWINEGRIALPHLLKQAGYNTAVFGKWGLGSDWNAAARSNRQGLDVSTEAIDYSKPIYSGKPYGFDHEEVHLWYGRNPYEKTYPCGRESGAIEKTDGARWYFKNGYSRDGNPDFASFDMEEAQMHYITQTVDRIRNADSPYFIYYAPHIPHWPHVPAPQFQGKTKMGYYGDFIAELDWAVGQIVKALEETDQIENTIVIFTSDNGPERQSYIYHSKGHASSGNWRGVKRDIWEGGHRTPFIVSWKGMVEGNQISNRLVCQTDIFATIADLLDLQVPNGSAEDSFSFLDALLPNAEVSEPRTHGIYHSGTSNTLAMRRGDWLYIDGPSGDNDRQEPAWFREDRGVVQHDESVELFDLKQNPQQTKNLASLHPEVAQEMKQMLEEAIAAGKTRN